MALPAGIPIGQGFTEAQWITWFQGVVKDNPKMPAYTAVGAKTTTGQSITGLTWDQVYAALYTAGQKTSPPQTPDVIAEDTIALMQTEATASGIGTTVTYTGTYATGAVEAAVAGASEAANSIPGVSALNAIQGFITGLTSANLWIRVAKMVVGSAMLLIGLAKLTGLDQKAGSIAATAVKTAPFI